jgi:hypothetical protein
MKNIGDGFNNINYKKLIEGWEKQEKIDQIDEKK